MSVSMSVSMKRAFHLGLFAFVVGGIALLNYVMVAHFNTLVWRYLWPYPAIFVLVFGFVILIWFPEIGRSIWLLRIVGALLIFIGECYLIHSFTIMMEYPSALSVAHFVGFIGMFTVMVLNYINQIRPKD